MVEASSLSDDSGSVATVRTFVSHDDSSRPSEIGPAMVRSKHGIIPNQHWLLALIPSHTPKHPYVHTSKLTA